MARPRKEGLDYFSHDTDAVDDEKVDAIRAMFGNDGYAFFFILCERIYRTDNAEFDVSKPVLMASIVAKVRVEQTQFDAMLNAAFDVGLFNREEYESRKVITSDGIRKRFSEVKRLRERWRKSKEPDDTSGVFHEENVQQTPLKTPESKVKQIKELKESYIAQFELFWDFYPNKKGKSAALKKWLSYGDEIDIEKVLTGTKDYIAFCKATERPYKDGSTFVNQKSWEDEWVVTGHSKVVAIGRGPMQTPLVTVTDEERERLAIARKSQIEHNKSSFAINH